MPARLDRSGGPVEAVDSRRSVVEQLSIFGRREVGDDPFKCVPQDNFLKSPPLPSCPLSMKTVTHVAGLFRYLLYQGWTTIATASAHCLLTSTHSRAAAAATANTPIAATYTRTGSK